MDRMKQKKRLKRLIYHEETYYSLPNFKQIPAPIVNTPEEIARELFYQVLSNTKHVRGQDRNLYNPGFIVCYGCQTKQDNNI